MDDSTKIPLPFLLLDDLPLLDGLLPDRFSFGTAARLAALVAFGLDDIHRTPAQGHRHGVARSGRGSVAFACITLAVLVGTQWPQPFVAATPAVALPASLRRAVPAGDPVAITYPYATGNTPQSMLWQAEDNFGFRLLGGYGYHAVRPSIDPSILLPSPDEPT